MTGEERRKLLIKQEQAASDVGEHDGQEDDERRDEISNISLESTSLIRTYFNGLQLKCASSTVLYSSHPASIINFIPQLWTYQLKYVSHPAMLSLRKQHCFEMSKKLKPLTR